MTSSEKLQFHQNPSVTAVVLAGGRGRRMGNTDKGLIRLNSKTLVERLLDSLSAQVGAIIINANQNLEIYARFGAPVVTDMIPDFQGPLAGILTAMHTCNTEYILTVPCDMPMLPADLCHRLWQRHLQSNSRVCVAHDGERMQPLCALISCSRKGNLEHYLKSGQRKVLRWIEQQNPEIVDFSSNAQAFANINTDQQRQQVRAKIDSPAL